MKAIYRIAPLVLAGFAVFAACDSGSDDEGAGGNGGVTAVGGSGGGSSATGGTAGSADNGGAAGETGIDLPVMKACKAYCAAEEDCKPDTTIQDCIDYTCVKFDGEVQACLDAMTAYYNCMAAAADPCSTSGCVAEGDAVAKAGCKN